MYTFRHVNHNTHAHNTQFEHTIFRTQYTYSYMKITVNVMIIINNPEVIFI